jgi:glutamate/tyrosine decarboxylase-like PLP-dependent enzyme
MHYSTIIGEMIAMSFNAPAFTWYSSPAATELENIIVDWLAKSYSLPDKFLLKNEGGGCVYNTVGEGIMLAIHTAKFLKR